MNAFFFLAAAMATMSCLSAAEPPAGFKALFNGRDLDGWRGGDTYDHRKLLALPEAERAAQIEKWTRSMTEKKADTGKPHWRVENNELVNDGLGGYATTVKDYRDFELLVEYRTVPLTDSGIYLRGVPQIQIWDRAAPDPRGNGNAKGSGGLWNNRPDSPGRHPRVVADRPIGDWNRFRIRMVGSRVSVWLNDQQVVDHAVLENYYDQKLAAAQRQPVPAQGPIQLQTHGGEIRWRNLFIREIGSAEAVQILASHQAKQFTSIFNGRDLAGWAGDMAAAEVKAGAIVWVKGQSGTVYWHETLADFQARVLFKVPPGGNNGLAIRYPGKGVAAYDAMTEIQILDENYEQVRGKIDPRQVHGSAAQMVGAARGYQFPLGEWNFQEVTAQGSRVKVELNGTIILDTDLAEVDLKKILGKRPQTGRDRREGFFGFAGHTDPVAFKDVFIRKL